MLNTKLQRLRDHFGIFKPEDWQAVEPSWILGIDGIGPKTLDYLRLLLAHRELTLKGDKTPEYWRRHIKEAEVVDHLGDLEDDDADRGVLLPYTILVDTAEQQPFTFEGLRSDADKGSRPLIVPVEFTSLGRYPDSLGDYSIDTGLRRCHVERKSIQDAHGTILGFRRDSDDGTSRRERFERELANLAAIEAGCVVVECTLDDLVRLAPETPKRSVSLNARTIFRSVLAFQQDHNVPWIFCDGRRMAEQATFRWLLRWAEKNAERRKEGRREAEQADKWLFAGLEEGEGEVKEVEGSTAREILASL